MGLVPEIDERPVIVCLCGSTRFSQTFQEANLRETLAGRIVLTIGCDTKSDVGLRLSKEDKERLDELHLHKVEMADEVLILNVDGYVGMSTSREIAYAVRLEKRLRWLEAPLLRELMVFDGYDYGGVEGCHAEGCRKRALWWWSARDCVVDGGGMFLCDCHAFVSDLQGNGL